MQKNTLEAGLNSGHPEIKVLEGIHQLKVEGRDCYPVKIVSGQPSHLGSKVSGELCICMNYRI